MTQIYYLARSYFPYDNGGGALMRYFAVDHLFKLGWKVTVIRPNYSTQELIIDKNVISIPFKFRYFQKLLSLFERIGIYEDYLDPWVSIAKEYLIKKVKTHDIIIATSGGELGMIKLGSLLKSHLNCKFVINFRDPLNYGYMRGIRRDKKPHIGRYNAQKKYILNSDLVITSSNLYAEVLKEGFPQIKHKVFNNYFGYGRHAKNRMKKIHKNHLVTIAYAGNLGDTQKPGFILDVVRNQKFLNLEIQFIGDIFQKSKFNLDNIYCKVSFFATMPHDKFQKHMIENVDIGLVSLSKEYFGACVPSKIYEYISLNLPILGFLPSGDAKDIINDNQFGIATTWGDLASSKEAITKIIKTQNLRKFKNNILQDKVNWSMKKRILEVNKFLISYRSKI